MTYVDIEPTILEYDSVPKSAATEKVNCDTRMLPPDLSPKPMSKRGAKSLASRKSSKGSNMSVDGNNTPPRSRSQGSRGNSANQEQQEPQEPQNQPIREENEEPAQEAAGDGSNGSDRRKYTIPY